MKDKLKIKLDERADKNKAFDALVEAAKGRELTEAEQTQLDTLDTEIEVLDGEIKKLQAIEARAAKNAAAAVGAVQDNYSEAKELAQYRYGKAFRDVHNQKQGRLGQVQGFEKEMHEEAHKEAEEAGIELQGNICIPSRLVQIGRKERLLDVTTEGADVVRTEYKPMIPVLQIDPVVDRLGITKYAGLKGDLKIPRSTNNLVLVWESESGAANELTLTYDAVDLSPKRVSGYTDVTLKMLVQSDEITEAHVMGKIKFAYEQAIDLAVIAGPTGGESPVGILNYSGVNVVSLGTSGGDLTYGAAVAMLAAPMADNARDGNNGWLFNTDGYAALLRTPRQASGVEGNFILNPQDTTLFGRRFIVTNRVPNDLTETTTSLSGMIYSPNWKSAILGTWGGVNILFDPYTQAGTGAVRFVINAFADVDIEHPEEFAVIKDWVTTTPAAT
jgi:HK97 family phage major capsid protein